MKQIAKRYSASEWAQMVNEQQQGMESIDAFCTRMGVGTSTFNKWRRRTAQSLLPAKRPPITGNGFVEAVPPSKATQPITLIINDHLRMELPAMLSAQAIADIANAVATRGRA